MNDAREQQRRERRQAQIHDPGQDEGRRRGERHRRGKAQDRASARKPGKRVALAVDQRIGGEKPAAQTPGGPPDKQILQQADEQRPRTAASDRDAPAPRNRRRQRQQRRRQQSAGQRHRKIDQQHQQHGRESREQRAASSREHRFSDAQISARSATAERPSRSSASSAASRARRMPARRGRRRSVRAPRGLTSSARARWARGLTMRGRPCIVGSVSAAAGDGRMSSTRTYSPASAGEERDAELAPVLDHDADGKSGGSKPPSPVESTRSPGFAVSGVAVPPARSRSSAGVGVLSPARIARRCEARSSPARGC